MNSRTTPLTLLRTVSAFLILLSMTSSPASAAPLLAIGKPAHDFGYATQGAIISHTFDIVNTGNEPLVISKMEPNLKLLTASLDKFTLYPHDHASLKLEYDSRYGMGRVEPAVTLTTSDPANATIIFKLVGHVFQQTATASTMPTGVGSSPRMMEPPARAVAYVWNMVSLFLGIH